MVIALPPAGCATHHDGVQAIAVPPLVVQALPASPDTPHRTASARNAVAALKRDLDAIFDAPITAHAQWAAVVRSAASGELLYERNAGRMMMPASNMKIVTLAGAAHTLGWDARFTTTLETAAAVDNGVLRGGLYVRGGGDPTINTRDARGAAVFTQWIAVLKAAGIEAVDGRIIGDDQRFDDEGLGAGWAWDYLQYGYAAPVGALQYNEDVATLSVRPGAADGSPAIVELSSGSGLTVVNKALTSAPGLPETIGYRRFPDRPVLEIVGTVPLEAPAATGQVTGVRTVSREVAVLNPTVFFVQAFKEALVEAGIRVSGGVADADELAGNDPDASPTGAPRRILARTESPPLRDIAAVMMKVSQNLYAETLLKAAGAAAGGAGTAETGRAAVQAALRELNIDDRSLVMADGSGLSRYDYVTADLLAAVLVRLHRDPAHRDPFANTLAIAGKDGTVSARLRKTRAEGNAQVKTGSISNVRTLSGYLRTRGGEPLAFAILANDFLVPGATVNWMTDLAVEVLANFSRPQ